MEANQNENLTIQAATLPLESSEPATLRLSDMAKRFDVDKKTIGRHVDVGLLPPPDFYVWRFPHWKIASIEKWMETKKCV